MSEFGNAVKDLMKDLDKRESLETQKKNNKKVVTYKIEASGIDMMVTRILNDKETRTLVLLLSQVDEDGKPVIIMKEKGKLLEVSERTLASFLDGDLEVHPVKTGCTAIPYLRKGASYIKALWAFIHSHKCIRLAKMGVYDLECLLEGYGDRYGDTCSPWFIGEDSWDAVIVKINRMSEEMFNNIHPKIIRYAVEHEMNTFGVSHSEALKNIYAVSRGYYGRTNSNEIDNGLKHVKRDALDAFIVIANRYDEPFAMKCMEEYLNDLNLSGLNGKKLLSLFTLTSRKSNVKRDYNQRVDGEHVGGPSLLYEGKNPRLDELAIQFDKKRFWEYILYATCIGRGKSLDNYIDLWKDYILMCQYVDDRIKEKYPEYLQIDHDIYSEKFDLIKNTIEEKKLMDATALASKICDVNTKGFQFRVLRKSQDFADEAAQNSNCVASYITRCANGDTIVGSFRPKGDEKTLLTVEISPKTYEMIQIRGKFNRYATEKEMEELNKIGTKISKRWEKYCKGEDIDKDDLTLEDFDEGGNDEKTDVL